ncbi:hypothetical protein ACFVRD_34870 [Streptomyces sp. NPDC057908]|uniref:hypothetical protein n=1 Tax=Streptomyces sp. NPDC057908 TaxID=3346276 RepID=UPI0036DFACDC
MLLESALHLQAVPDRAVPEETISVKEEGRGGWRVRLEMPTEHARLEGHAYDPALQKWAHKDHEYNSVTAARRYSAHLLLDIMTPAEARE